MVIQCPTNKMFLPKWDCQLESGLHEDPEGLSKLRLNECSTCKIGSYNTILIINVLSLLQIGFRDN